MRRRVTIQRPRPAQLPGGAAARCRHRRVLLDAHVSAVEGSIGAIPRRLAVLEEDEPRRGACCRRPARREWQTTDGHVAGRPGALRPAGAGYRTGIEPVLLAASVPARPGERVLEAGTGAGAGLLCLAARVPGVRGSGIELTRRSPRWPAPTWPPTAADGPCARGDVAAAGACGPSTTPSPTRPGTTRPARRRRCAARVGPSTWPPPGCWPWIERPGGRAARRGTLSLALPAALLAEAGALLLAAGSGRWRCCRCGRGRDVAAKLVLLQARRGRGRRGCCPGWCCTPPGRRSRRRRRRCCVAAGRCRSGRPAAGSVRPPGAARPRAASRPCRGRRGSTGRRARPSAGRRAG